MLNLDPIVSIGYLSIVYHHLTKKFIHSTTKKKIFSLTLFRLSCRRLRDKRRGRPFGEPFKSLGVHGGDVVSIGSFLIVGELLIDVLIVNACC
jgi:hypothetical protein